jgi:hypothetical protein
MRLVVSRLSEAQDHMSRREVVKFADTLEPRQLLKFFKFNEINHL